MRQKYAISNQLELSFSLTTLLTSLRFQRVSYIPESMLFAFREFCALLFYLHVRDKFSHSLRRFSKLAVSNSVENHLSSSNDSELTVTSLQIIDCGNLMLSYGTLLKHEQIEVQDIVVSAVSRLSRLRDRSLQLERKLAKCVQKRPTNIEDEGDEILYDAESFQAKLEKLLNEWKTLEYSASLNMFDVYEHSAVEAVRSERTRVLSVYGESEDAIVRVHLKGGTRTQPYSCGGFEFEQSEECAEFLELFFKLAFEQSENWETLCSACNRTPILPEFYEEIYEREIHNEITLDHQYLLLSDGQNLETGNTDFTESNMHRRRRAFLAPNKNSVDQQLTLENPRTRRTGLFSSYSTCSDQLADFNKQSNTEKFEEKKLEAKKVNNCEENKNHYLSDQPLKVMDFGPRFIETSKLAIWLVKWADRLQKMLMAHKRPNSLWLDSSQLSQPAMKLCSLNANMLVACAFLAQNNHLHFTANEYVALKPGPKLKRREANNVRSKPEEEEFTQISSSVNTDVRRVVFQNQKGNFL